MHKEVRQIAVLTAALVACCSGCSLWNEQLSPSLKAEVATGDAIPPAAPQEQFTIEVHTAEGQPQKKEYPLTAELHVQEALEKSGLLKKFRRVNVQLLRPMKSGGWHKMQLEFDIATRRVPAEFDYAVLPGDRLVVVEDTSNMFTDLIDNALQPLGVKPTKKKATLSDKYEFRG